MTSEVISLRAVVYRIEIFKPGKFLERSQREMNLNMISFRVSFFIFSLIILNKTKSPDVRHVFFPTENIFNVQSNVVHSLLDLITNTSILIM